MVGRAAAKVFIAVSTFFFAALCSQTAAGSSAIEQGASALRNGWEGLRRKLISTGVVENSPLLNLADRICKVGARAEPQDALMDVNRWR